MKRRDALKLLTGTAAATLASRAFATNTAPNAVMAVMPDPSTLPVPPTDQKTVDSSPERLISAEPTIQMSADGKASLMWSTVTPTQGATVYIGLPSYENRLMYPIYVLNTTVKEDAPVMDHKATLDIASFINRFAVEYKDAGGVVAYRIEMLDPRKPAARFIDRTMRVTKSGDTYGTGVNIIDGPFVTQTVGDKAVIWWETDVASQGSVKVDGKSFSDNATAKRHVVNVSGLTRGKRASYAVTAGVGKDRYTTPTYDFPAEANGGDFSFVFTCDGRTGALGGGETALEGINGESARALSAQMLRHSPAFLIFTGDLISGYTTSEDDFRAQMKSWKRLYGPLGRYMPIYTGMGNHESLLDTFTDGTYYDKSGDGAAEVVFASEFVNPMNGPAPEAPGLPPYKGAVYSFDYGGSHFVQLNTDYWVSTNPGQVGGNFFGRLLPGQLAWFEQDVKAAKAAGARHIFVFAHEPAFPNGGHVQDSMWGGGTDPDAVAARDRFWQICVDNGVVATFHGHEHNYSRTLIDASTPVHKDGSTMPSFNRPVHHVLQGAAGAPFYARDLNVPWVGSVKQFVRHLWCYSHITVKGDKVRLETYSYTGDLMDSADLT
ncbi:metallophosphoesterase family protein [Deinococcus rubellus]|uniref:metallophosphoesterase family protein n=1 Tax=Deinococcus rubellus TaxID=1889240 RepID=UPI0031E8923E